jgi:hypothetical protein
MPDGIKCTEHSDDSDAKEFLPFTGPKCCWVIMMTCFVVCIVLWNRTVCVQHSFQTRSRNSCCRGKELSIKYSEFMSVALVTQRATGMNHIVSCGLSGPALFFHIIS